MAENFEDVVKKLGSTVKKPSAAKAPAVLAVQMAARETPGQYRKPQVPCHRPVVRFHPTIANVVH